jgi:malate/lactate dehydrogenase
MPPITLRKAHIGHINHTGHSDPHNFLFYANTPCPRNRDKGATNFAIGLSGARIAEAVLRDGGAILPVSSVLENYHGIRGIALPVPSVVDASGISHAVDVAFSVQDQELFQRSAAALTASLNELGI